MRKGTIRIAALDIFFAVLVITVLLGAFARYLLTEENGLVSKTPERADAAVSLLITGIEGTSSEHFVEGAEFTLTDAAYAGVLIADFTVTPAEYYEENEAGELVLAYYDEENGKIDCRGAVKVSGFYRDGVYYIEGQTVLTAGMELTVSNGKLTATAIITDISPISHE